MYPLAPVSRLNAAMVAESRVVARRLHPPALYTLPEERLVQTGHADQPVDHGAEYADWR